MRGWGRTACRVGSHERSTFLSAVTSETACEIVMRNPRVILAYGTSMQIRTKDPEDFERDWPHPEVTPPPQRFIHSLRSRTVIHCTDISTESPGLAALTAMMDQHYLTLGIH